MFIALGFSARRLTPPARLRLRLAYAPRLANNLHHCLPIPLRTGRGSWTAWGPLNDRLPQILVIGELREAKDDFFVAIGEKTGLAVDDHLLPSPLVLGHDRHAGGHRLQANPRPVLLGPAVEPQHGMAAAKEVGHGFLLWRKVSAQGGRGPHLRSSPGVQPMAIAALA